MSQVPIRKAKKLLKKGFHMLASVHYVDGYEGAFVRKKRDKTRVCRFT